MDELAQVNFDNVVATLRELTGQSRAPGSDDDILSNIDEVARKVCRIGL